MPKGDSGFLKQLRDEFDYDTAEWRDIRDEARKDMRCVAGNPWSDKDRKLREDASRPVLSLDELGQYVNQLINEVRQHKRAIQVTPMGNGANDDTARLRADLIRQIEYRSNAQQAYTTMFENTVQRSYGFLRVQAKKSGLRSFNYELKIEPIMNPDLVTMDADAILPDGSDMKRAFIHESWRLADYKKRFPRAKVRDFSADLAIEAPKWISEQRIQLAEYWCIDHRPRTLLLVQPAQGRPVEVFADELTSERYRMLTQRPVLRDANVDYPYVTSYLTNGLEILEESDWPGTSIPLVFCPGKVLYVDEGDGAKRKMLSLIRLARDPYMLYCYYRTCEAELVGMTPKFPYIAYRGQLSAEEQLLLAKSLHEPVSLIQVEPLVDGVMPGTVLPLPSRQPYEPPIQALEIGAEAARRAIQAAMGISALPTSAQRRNEKSGIALQEMKQSEQQGSFHFIDHYEMAITRAGAILNELLPDYYDSAREVTLRTPADETRVVTINDPTVPDEQTGQPLMLTPEGQHDITLSTGPSYDSEREAASDFADQLAGNPQVFPLIGDLVVKLKNLGPVGDQIVERLKAMLPPQVQQAEAAKKADPAQLMQQLQQMQQMLQMVSQELDAKTKVIETDQVKAQQQLQIETIKQEFESTREQLRLSTEKEIKFREIEAKLEIEAAKLGSAASLKRAELEQQELHAHSEQQLRREELGAEQAQADMDRQAERDEAQDARAFDAAQGAEERQTKLALAEQKASSQPGA